MEESLSDNLSGKFRMLQVAQKAVNAENRAVLKETLSDNQLQQAGFLKSGVSRNVIGLKGFG